MNDIPKSNDTGLSTGARDELRLRVLRALEANPELSQRQLAAGASVELADQSNTSVSMPLPGITVHPTEIEHIRATVSDAFRMFGKRIRVTSFFPSRFMD